MIGRGRGRIALLAGAAVLAALLPVAPVVVGGGAPASAVVFFGLDCGIAGEYHSLSLPHTYSLTATITAGPYVTNGTNASLSCTLRRDSRSGTVIASWGSSAGGGTNVPPMVPQVLQTSFTALTFPPHLYLCSRVSWTTVNGPQTDVGCEHVRSDSLLFPEPLVVGDLAKPQDHDLNDDSFPS